MDSENKTVDMHTTTTTEEAAARAIDVEHSMGLKESLRIYRRACLWSILVSTCIIMEGFDQTMLNNLYAYPPFKAKYGVRRESASGAVGYELTAQWQSGLSNGAQAGQILGLFLNGFVADRYGYRVTLVGALAACVAFTFIIFFSETLPVLLVGEVLVGVPWGFFQTLAPTYAADVCPTHLRAQLTTYVNLCWVIGQLAASGVMRAMLSRDDDWGYRIPFALQWAWPVPLAVGIWMAPESPWWLIRRGRLDEARRSLARLADRASDRDLDRAISAMVHTDELERGQLAGTTYLDLFRGVNLRRTEIVCAAWMAQHWVGCSLMGYSTYFYQNAGMDVADSFTLSLGQYALGAVGTVSSWFLMVRLGRRTLYLAGQLSMLVLLLVIGSCGAYSYSSSSSSSLSSSSGGAARQDGAVQWAVGSLLLLYTFAYDCTVGPVCYSLVSELTSTRMRTKSIVLARNCYNVMAILANVITPNMLNPSAWDWGARSAYFFAGTCLVCLVWTFFRLPEPKGRTYAELDILFERKVSARKFSSTRIARPVSRRDETGSPAAAAVDGSRRHGEKTAQAVEVEHVGSRGSSKTLSEV